jgi:hypothetical protein
VEYIRHASERWTLARRILKLAPVRKRRLRAAQHAGLGIFRSFIPTASFVLVLMTWGRMGVLPIIEEIEWAGIISHNAIAAKPNERNVRTARGGKWTHVQVGAVLRPFAKARPSRSVPSGRRLTRWQWIARQNIGVPKTTFFASNEPPSFGMKLRSRLKLAHQRHQAGHEGDRIEQ